MSDQLWVVRAGREAIFADQFIDGSYIAISFNDFESNDLSSTNQEVLKSRVTSPAERSFASQLIAFAYRMEVGDLVIVPRLTTTHRDYLVARIIGHYRHVEPAPESGTHQRPVEWLGTFTRESLSSSAAGSLGAIATVFRPTSGEAELRGLLTSLAPLDGSASPANIGSISAKTKVERQVVGYASPGRPIARAQLDIDIDTEGRARINSGHPALVMEQTSRHTDPRHDWSGVPGIYVLTGTELQHSSTRTGQERTLTTTLIVRPWAYVGLSEDFMGRIGSHRQSKPEWRRALLVRSAGQHFASDDIKYLEQRVHYILEETGEVALGQARPRGNLSAHPRNTAMLDACADTVVAVLRLTGTLI